MVEEQGDLNGQLQNGVSFRSEVEGQDLVGVGEGKTGKRDTVRPVVQEEEGDGLRHHNCERQYDRDEWTRTSFLQPRLTAYPAPVVPFCAKTAEQAVILM